MKVVFTVLACVVFALLFGYITLVAKTTFDAAWLIAILTIPASSLADIVSRLGVLLFATDQKSILVDLGLLFVFGLMQYGLLGYLLGWGIDQFRKPGSRN